MNDDDEPGDRALPSAARVATFAIPTLAVAVTALVLVGPGALRPALSVRIRGAPGDGARVVALRIEGTRSVYGIDDAAVLRDLRVEASAPGQTLPTWTGATGPDGIADVRFEAGEPIRGALALRVSTTEDLRPRVLAEGQIELPSPPPAFARLGRLSGRDEGDFTVRVDVSRGILAAPFPEEIRVAVSPRDTDGPLGAPADLTLSAPGIELSPQRLTTDARGVASFRAKPLAHDVELTIAIHARGQSGTWEGPLPIIPGALWIDPAPAASGAIEIVSPVPRKVAYASFWSEEGRVGGATVTMTPDASGFFRGQVAPPPAASARIFFATVGGDPAEQSAGAVAWPIRPDRGSIAPRPLLRLLLDGVPAAVDREKARAWTARRAGVLVLGAAAIVEMLLLVLRSRAAQRHLEAHLRSASGGAEGLSAADQARLIHSAREYPVLRALLFAAVIGFGFAVVAALATFR